MPIEWKLREMGIISNSEWLKKTLEKTIETVPSHINARCTNIKVDSVKKKNKPKDVEANYEGI